MISFKTFLFILLTSLVFTSSACKKKDDGGIGAGDSCKISYKIGGQSFTATPTICAYLDATLNIGLIGSNKIQLQLNNLTSTGDYAFDDPDVILIVDDDAGNRYGGTSGTVKVTQLSNGKAKGTFSGTVTDIAGGGTSSVMDGSFETNY